MADGMSDRALMPILSWLLRKLCGSLLIQPEIADLRRINPSPRGLAERISRSVELYPCDLLFVHRDVERATIEDRLSEISAAVMQSRVALQPVICVVPVRMQEAWLLIDEAALRRAAGNPNGRAPLNLPRVQSLEQLPDPKRMLHELLRQASGLRGRRLRSFNRRLHGYAVAERINDFTPLCGLPAFRRLAGDLGRVVTENGWNDASR